MGKWEPQKCQHGNMGLAGGCEECFDHHQELTAVAHTRCGLEEARDVLLARAKELWIEDRTEVANEVKFLAKKIGERAKQESLKQDKLLKARGL